MSNESSIIGKSLFDDGSTVQGSSPLTSSEVCQTFVSSTLKRLFFFHSKGPCETCLCLVFLEPHCLKLVILVALTTRLMTIVIFFYTLHQKVMNKSTQFNGSLGFVTQLSSSLEDIICSPLDMNDSKAYLVTISDILSSGRPNYHGRHIPLPSVFNWNYLDKHITSYHDGYLIDYLQFGFPLSLDDCESIIVMTPVIIILP